MLLGAAVGGRAADLDYAGPVDAAQLAEPTNREASGLAASRRAPDLLWTHNDSGGDPILFALDARTGARRGRVRLEGIKNTDWEDIAAYTLDGRAWLLVADTGDNFSRRKQVVLHVLEEPDPATLRADAEITVRPAFSIAFVYEDGARDCEAVAVDPAEKMVYLLSKRDVPARLYRLPLQPAAEKTPAAARFVVEIPHIPQPDPLQKAIQLPTFALRGMPTAMDFSADGSVAAVLVYSNLMLFPRGAGEFWASALARRPVFLAPPQLPQAEAVCFSPDGRQLYVTSEKSARLLRYDRR